MNLNEIKNWFFDIDDTIIDTAGVNGMAAEGIGEVVRDKFSQELSSKFVEEFVAIFDLMLLGYRIKNIEEWVGREDVKKRFEELIGEIEVLQDPVKEKWGAIKKWSREVFIKIAADRCGMRVTPDFIQEAADAYWLTLTEKTLIFSGAKKLIDKLQSNSCGVYLITSSDGRLIMRDDGLFEYDPKVSEALKRQRIELLRERGIHYDVLSIGDPEDKPHLDFFQKGLKAVEVYSGKGVDCNQSVMIGDSFAGDLQTPLEKLDFACVILFEKSREKTEEDGRVIKIGDLEKIAERV